MSVARDFAVIRFATLMRKHGQDRREIDFDDKCRRMLETRVAADQSIATAASSVR
jgi:hypothetical protein